MATQKSGFGPKSCAPHKQKFVFGVSSYNLIRPGLFSRLPGPRGSQAWMPKIKVNIIQIEMKLGMSHYDHKSIPDAKFESASSSSFGDMTSQNFPGRGRVIKFGYLPPENGFNLKKMSFYVQNRSSRPKVDPHVNFSNFQSEEIFHFVNFWDVAMRKSSSNPLIDQFC